MSMLNVGLIGTGFVARLRAEALRHLEGARLVAIAGHTPDATAAFSQSFEATAWDHWQALVERDDIDLVLVCHVNDDHGAAAEAALQAGKHVVVEYPLALEVSQAERLVALAQAQKRLLHVEHIELLGGVHQAFAAHVDVVGTPWYSRYVTLSPKRPAPQKWTYQPQRFGFPLIGALSRIHRLTSVFGPVTRVFCQNRYDGVLTATLPEGAAYRTCWCTAQLQFASGLVAEVTYGKGEQIWATSRLLEVHGSCGSLRFEGDQGQLTTAEGDSPITVGSRRGLFAKDTQAVIEHLTTGAPLYCRVEDSLHSLKVAAAAEQSAATGDWVAVEG